MLLDTSPCRACQTSRARLAITDLEHADTINDTARRQARLADLIELALNGAGVDRDEAAAYLERRYGCAIATAPAREPVAIH